MRFGRTSARLLLVASLTAGGLVASSAPAAAPFHFMMVVEVFAGTPADANADFVELQMYADGQKFIGGHLLHFYGPPTYPGEPSPKTDCTIPVDVANGVNQDRILFATTQFQTAFGTADFTMPPLLSGAGGAVCFEGIDCVSWGSFAGSTTSPSGTPEPGGIPADMSIDRTTGGILDPTDDTNDSATDFSSGPQSATPNGPTNLGALTCQAAPPAPGTPGGQPIVQGLKAKAKGNKAIISGQIAPPAPGEKVTLTFFANGSPLKKVAKKTAVLNADSRFKKKFKIPTESTKCKVRVAFKGDNLGKKKFKC